MRIRYSPRIREHAALICQVAASTGTASYMLVSERLGFGRRSEAEELAWKAWRRARLRNQQHRWLSWREIDAESEAMIRNGEI